MSDSLEDVADTKASTDVSNDEVLSTNDNKSADDQLDARSVEVIESTKSIDVNPETEGATSPSTTNQSDDTEKEVSEVVKSNEEKSVECNDIGPVDVVIDKVEISTAITSEKLRPVEHTDDSSLSEEQTSEDSKSCVAPSNDVDYAQHVTYKEDGSAIYTDPKTKYQFKWCTETDSWTPYATITATENDPYENEHYKWCQKTQKWIPKQSQSQVTETEHYKWDAEKREWIPKVTTKETSPSQTSEIVYDIDEDGNRTYTDKDGVAFFWDTEKNAWFPKIDEDFMARYQMSYGFIDNTSESIKEKEQQAIDEDKRKQDELEMLTEEAITNDEASNGSTKGVKRKAQQEPPQWFDVDPSRNTKVYVSNLPLDITLEEFTELMGKCGMIMRDPVTQNFKLKLYAEPDGQLKGDGLCDYIKVESVDLALKILDEYNLRGNKIHVQRAQFQMRGEYNPALKPKRKKKDKEKLAKIKEKLFDWRPEKMRGERSKHEKTVIIKNLFHPEVFEKDVQLILDYQNDLREECSKCGTVKKVVIYDRHSEGVGQVNMSSPEEADVVIQMMQGRFFGKRQLTADHWDGKTKYKVEESEDEINKRLNKWDKYLETTDVSESRKATSEME